jgi:hypothetical protein
LIDLGDYSGGKEDVVVPFAGVPVVRECED